MVVMEQTRFSPAASVSTSPEHSGSYSTLPLFFRLTSSDTVLIVGGGEVAWAKARTIITTEARLRIVAPEFSEEFKKFLLDINLKSGTDRIAVIEQPYEPLHIDGVRFAIAATDDRNLNLLVRADAHRTGALVNVVDDPELCDCFFPAIVRRGSAQIAIGTHGIAPMLARNIKYRIENVLPHGIEKLGEYFIRWKDRFRSALPNPQRRRPFLDAILSGPISQLAIDGKPDAADSLTELALQTKNPAPVGALYIVGAGPGHPDLITVRAASLLGKADVILYDRLVSQQILDRYARKDGTLIQVGKFRGGGCTQDEINSLIRRHLTAKRIVVRLKGGDPGIFARLAEELSVAEELNVPVEIVPGVTAALGCAAHAGIPLTERSVASSLRLITLFQNDFEEAPIWASLDPQPEETLVFYMTGTFAVRVAEELLRRGYSPQTLVLLVEQGTTPNQRTYHMTLADFVRDHRDHRFASPSLLIVGDVTRWHARRSAGKFGQRQAAGDPPLFFEAPAALQAPLRKA